MLGNGNLPAAVFSLKMLTFSCIQSNGSVGLSARSSSLNCITISLEILFFFPRLNGFLMLR